MKINTENILRSVPVIYAAVALCFEAASYGLCTLASTVCSFYTYIFDLHC